MNQKTHHPLRTGLAMCVAVWSGAVVPVLPAYASLITADKPASEGAAAQEDDAQRPLAEYARTVGSLLSADSAGTLAQDRLRTMATGAATTEVEQWLSRFGQARVRVDVDREFSLRNSEFDLLFPWYETPKWLLFTQHSLHHTDDRNQMNNGIGVRHFGSMWMTGVNAFYDQDFSGTHSRGGVGAELWRDYLKLSANSYFRLSSWRNVPELNNDYVARPADGWDVRAEGWLPAYPQLGGTLMYEQYYGKEVALYGREYRQKNPAAMTVGLNWSPIPLMTFSAERSTGNGGINDTRFGVQVNISLGVGLAAQLSPGAVRSHRTLTGSRLDMVERNNNIVLAYHKKELIRFSLRQSLAGYPGDRLSVVESLTTKYPLKNIEWNAAEFIRAGGRITGQGLSTVLTLPAYRVNADPALAEKNNTYVLEGTALDSQGNTSSLVRTQVVVSDDGTAGAGTGHIAAGNLTVVSDNAKADGNTANHVQVVVTDEEGNLLANQTVNFSADNGATITHQGTTGTDGSVTVAVTSLTAGTSNVTASINNSSQTVSTRFVALQPVYSLTATTQNDPYQFAAGSGFPATGFKGATFTVDLPSGTSATDYTWSARNAGGTAVNWLTVDQGGIVTFNNPPSTADKNVEIIATPKEAGGQPLGYQFTLTGWFINNGSVTLNWNDADNWCNNQSGYGQATIEQLSGEVFHGTPGHYVARGLTGGFWSEWGDLARYAGAGFLDAKYWGTNTGEYDNYSFINLSQGVFSETIPQDALNVVCRKSL